MSRTSWIIVKLMHKIYGVLAVVGLIWPATESMAQGTPQTTIRLSPQTNRGAISPFIYGTNQRYNNSVCGTWDANENRMVSSFDNNHREAGLKSMRYPGGTVGSTFEWKKAIGPVAQRRNMQPAQGGPPEIVSFGVDEAARWCEANDVELVYMYGIGAPNSNAQDAGDLIEYLNSPVGQNPNGGIDWAQKRADNGRVAPYNIKYFEIANEADGPNTVQRFWLDAINTDATRAKPSTGQAAREAYAPEYCFGGEIILDKQLIADFNDFRDAAAKSNGQANQRKMIRYFPIIQNSETVFVGTQAWTRVPDITKATGNVYQVDAGTGTVLFGNGTNGAIPPAGTNISVSYRAHRDGFVDYYPVMKAVDPNILIFIGYASPNIITTLGSTYLYDGIVIHPYTNEWNVPSAATLNDWHHNIMLSSAHMGEEIRSYQDYMEANVTPSRKGLVKVICTEWGLNNTGDLLPASASNKSTYLFLSDGLYNATQLMHFMRQGMPHAERHCTTVGVFGPAPDFVPSPSAMSFQLFSKHFGDQMIGLEIQNNPMRPTNNVKTGNWYNGYIKKSTTAGVPADAELLQLPKLEAEASRDAGGNLYLMVVNQDASDDVATNIQIDNLTASGTVEVWTLNGPSATAYNTTQNPNAVNIVSSSSSLQNGALQYVFPAHSMTALKIKPDMPTSTRNVIINPAGELNAYVINSTEIHIEGEVNNNAIATLYDVQGKTILVRNLEKGSLHVIPIPSIGIRRGIYVLSVNDKTRLKTFKIMIR